MKKANCYQLPAILFPVGLQAKNDRMQYQAFVQSISQNKPPEKLTVYLSALWYDAKGDWHEAHSMIDHLHDEAACWVHAYLHRKEGDIANADYWYRRAGKIRPSVSLQEEWETIVRAML